MTEKIPHQNQSEGFTLIETLVTVILVGVIAAIATPSFLNWFNNKKIEDGLAKVEGALALALSTSIRINEPCAVTISSGTITASPAKCLPAGPVDFGTSSNITTQESGGSTITFSPKGTATIVENKSVVVLYDNDAPSSRRMKCVVVSSGVGLMRAGNYEASSPPANGADVDTIESQCITPS